MAASVRATFAGILHRRAIQVRAARRRGGGGVRHFVGARRHHAHAIGRDAQLARRDHRDVCVNTLAHLRPAVVHLRGAILINQHQRAGLVEVRGRERNPELHRRDREAALAIRMLRVPHVKLLAARREVARRASVPARRAGCDCPRSPARSASCWSRRCRDKDCAARTTSGGSPVARAMRSMISSITSIPCGPPKPRKAVFEARLVFATVPLNSTCGM